MDEQRDVLVEEEDTRFMQHGTAEGEALLPPGGEICDERRRAPGEHRHVERVLHGLCEPRARRSGDPAEETYVGPDRLGRPYDAHAIDEPDIRARRQQRAQHADQRGFAGPADGHERAAPLDDAAHADLGIARRHRGADVSPSVPSSAP